MRVQNNEALWQFTAVALEGAAIALVAAVILAIGLCILVLSITYLFELRDPGRLIPDIWIVSLSLFWSLRAMSTLPQPGERPEALTLQFNKALPFLLDWALVPIWCAYLTVLYTYAAKILIEWSLPRGNVAWMVHGFGALGVAVWLMVWPRRDTGPALTRLFQRWFWWTLPIPLLLLAIGILERVSAYGWTEPRYMVAAGGLWLAAMALIFGLLPRRVPLVLAPLSLAVLCLLSTFGPWSAVSVSVRDQHGRLTSLLTRHGILADGRIVPAKDPESVPSSDVHAINSAVRFLVAHDRLDIIRAWYPPGVSITGQSYDAGGPGHIVTTMGLPPLDHAGRLQRAQRSITTIFGLPNWMRDRDPLLLDISGYDAIGQVSFNGAEDVRRLQSPDFGRPFVLQLDRAALRLLVEGPSGRTTSFDLSSALSQLFDAAGKGPLVINQPQVATITAHGDVRARLAIQSATLEKTATGFLIPELSFVIALADR